MQNKDDAPDPLDDAEVICEVCESGKAVWDCQSCCVYACVECFDGDVCINCLGLGEAYASELDEDEEEDEP